MLFADGRVLVPFVVGLLVTGCDPTGQDAALIVPSLRIESGEGPTGRAQPSEAKTRDRREPPLLWHQVRGEEDGFGPGTPWPVVSTSESTAYRSGTREGRRGRCRAGRIGATTDLAGWLPTWSGSDGLAVLPGGRILAADQDRITLVDAASSPAVTIGSHVQAQAGFLSAGLLDDTRLVVIRRRGTREAPTTLLTVYGFSTNRLWSVGELELADVRADRLQVAGSTAYLRDWTKAYTVDLSRPEAPSLVTSLDFGIPVDLAFNEATGNLLVLDADGVLVDYDLADPVRPRAMSRIELLTCRGERILPELHAGGRAVVAVCQSHDYPANWGVMGDGLFLDAADLSPVAPVPFARQPFSVYSLDPDHLAAVVQDPGDSQGHGACMPIASWTKLQVFHWSGKRVFERHQRVPFWPPGRHVTSGPGLVVERGMGRVERWSASPPGLTEVPVHGGGPPGLLVRHGELLSAEGPRTRHELEVSGWPELRFAGPVTYRDDVELVVSPGLRPGPLLTVADPATHQEPPGCFHAPHRNCRVQLDTGTAACTHFEPVASNDVTDHIAARASGPWFVLVRELAGELVLETFDEPALAFRPAVPVGRTAREPTCAWRYPEVVGAGDEAGVAGVTVTCGPDRLFLLADLSTPAAPAFTHVEVETGAPVTRDMRVSGDRLARLRGSGGDTVLQLASIDRHSVPWQLGGQVEVALPDAERLLLFDGRMALVGGRARVPSVDARGALWLVDVHDTPPVVTELTLPVQPESALALPDGFLVASPGGIGAVTLGCAGKSPPGRRRGTRGPRPAP